MHIRVGYELIYHCPQATPMILLVNMHYSRASDIVVPDYLTTDPSVPITAYRDPFGNWCNRIVAPSKHRSHVRGCGEWEEWDRTVCRFLLAFRDIDRMSALLLPRPEDTATLSQERV